MKIIALVYLFALAVLLGSTETSALAATPQSAGDAIAFSERGAGTLLSEGEAGLDVTATVKTHEARPSFSPDNHGTPAFRLKVTIDGQTESWQGTFQEEKNRSLDLTDPEAGNGIKYRFYKPLRLKASVHRICIALPDDGVSVVREIRLEEGRVHTLVLEPVYSSKLGKPRPGLAATTSFKEGIRTFRVILNGKQVEG